MNEVNVSMVLVRSFFLMIFEIENKEFIVFRVCEWHLEKLFIEY